MPFFERPEPPPEEDEDDEFEPFDDPTVRYLGGVVPLELVLARSDSAAVAVRGLVAYPDGFELKVVTYTRRQPEGSRRRRGFRHRPVWLDPFDLYEGEDDKDLPAEFLRFGIEFPDGVRVTNLTSQWPLSPDATEPMHGMESHSGSGCDTQYEQEFWVWPVPEEGGELAFVCEWPVHGIAESRVEIEAALVQEAADRAQPVWPDAIGPRTHFTRGAMMRLATARGRRPEETDDD